MNKKLITGLGALALAGCSTVVPPPPPQIVVAPPPVVIDNPMTVAAERQVAMTFPGKELKWGHYAMLPAKAQPKTGPVTILVSLRLQRTYVFKAGQLVAVSTSSHGTPDHPTDPGQWKILQKKPFHRSNKYSNAPMPHMQRLDKWGRAFHGGVVPGYPASHGCIRLPPLMAKALFGMTKVGDVVDIEA